MLKLLGSGKQKDLNYGVSKILGCLYKNYSSVNDSKSSDEHFKHMVNQNMNNNLVVKKPTHFIDYNVKKETLQHKFDDDHDFDDDKSMRSMLKHLRPSYKPWVYNLAYFVNDSKVLQKFIEMGVNIKKWDKNREISEFVLRLDYDKNVAPYLIFLHDIGIKPNDYATIISKNPHVLKEELDDLKVRINYLESKKFKKEDICSIIVKSPKWLTLTVNTMDTNLGWYQREFKLTGNELRAIMIDKPKLNVISLKIPSDMKFCLKEFLLYNDEQIKHMIKTDPKLFTKNYKNVQTNFTYLLDIIKFNENEIAQHPTLLHMSFLTLKSRFGYLKHLGFDQFDPTKPNFVSSKDLYMHDDVEFCKKVTKTSIDDYEEFLKTL